MSDSETAAEIAGTDPIVNGNALEVAEASVTFVTAIDATPAVVNCACGIVTTSVVPVTDDGVSCTATELFGGVNKTRDPV